MKGKIMEFTEQEITLSLTPYAYKETPRIVAAHACGPLAYHQSVQADNYWSITHIPTGRGIANFIPSEKCAQVIIGMAYESGIDWNQTDPNFVDRMDDKTKVRAFIAGVNEYLGR